MRNACIMLALLIAVGLAGCGGGGGEGGDPIDNALLGVWQPISATVDEQVVSPAQAMDWDAGIVRITMQFSANRTCTERDYDEQGLAATETGTWTAQGGSATLTMGEDEIDLDYSFDGQVLTEIPHMLCCWA